MANDYLSGTLSVFTSYFLFIVPQEADIVSYSDTEIRKINRVI